MDSEQLDNICAIIDPEISKSYLGTFAVDTIPRRISPGFCCIVNTDPVREVGSHWVAIYCEKNGRAEYFCSYGREPGIILGKRLASIFPRGYKMNKNRLQSKITTVCGPYCVYYLHCRTRGKTLSWVQNKFSKRNYIENDSKIKEFMYETYKFSVPLIDGAYLKELTG